MLTLWHISPLGCSVSNYYYIIIVTVHVMLAPTSGLLRSVHFFKKKWRNKPLALKLEKLKYWKGLSGIIMTLGFYDEFNSSLWRCRLEYQSIKVLYLRHLLVDANDGQHKHHFFENRVCLFVFWLTMSLCKRNVLRPIQCVVFGQHRLECPQVWLYRYDLGWRKYRLLILTQPFNHIKGKAHWVITTNHSCSEC